jgi:formylmethanofuran dehydrogenase subunit E
MGLYGGKLLGLDVPRKDKRLFVFTETDGCGAGGLSVATNSWVDRRNMRVMDFGKVAATFVDTETGKAVRVIPHPESRLRAWQYAPDAEDNWHAMFEGYQVMPDEELMIGKWVQLTVSMEKIISQPGMRTICDQCGEEISNQREVRLGEETLCRSCAGEGYYQTVLLSQPVYTPADQNGHGTNGNGRHPLQLVCVIGKSGKGKNGVDRRTALS